MPNSGKRTSLRPEGQGNPELDIRIGGAATVEGAYVESSLEC